MKVDEHEIQLSQAQLATALQYSRVDGTNYLTLNYKMYSRQPFKKVVLDLQASFGILTRWELIITVKAHSAMISIPGLLNQLDIYAVQTVS